MGASTERKTTLHTSGLDITFWVDANQRSDDAHLLPAKSRTKEEKRRKKLPCNMRCAAGSNCTQNGGGGRWIRNCPRVVREYDFLCSSFLQCVPSVPYHLLRQQRTSADGSCCCCRTSLQSLLLCWVEPGGYFALYAALELRMSFVFLVKKCEDYWLLHR